MTDREQLLDLLNRIQKGEITPEEGLQKMQSVDKPIETGQPRDAINASESDNPSLLGSSIVLNGEPSVASPDHPYSSLGQEERNTPAVANTPEVKSGQAERITGQPVGEEEAGREIRYWKSWWYLPFWIGTFIMTLGAIGMYLGYTAARFGIGFWLSWIPFFLGVIVMAISWQSRLARWLHVRIHQEPGERPGSISISLPLPLGLASWFLRNFSHLIPGLRDQKFSGSDLSDILISLGQSVSPENPFYVHVNGNNGEEVEVFIG